jgi:hypothetical protein
MKVMSPQVILGNAGLFATVGVVAPDLRQVEADIGEGGLLAAGEAGAHRAWPA